MSRPAPACPFYSGRFPRVSGDEPTLSLSATLFDEFSPRERG